MMKKLFSILNMIMPKTNIILFNSFPYYSDNSKSVFEYIVNERHDIMENNTIYWVADDITSTEHSHLSANVQTIKKKSLKGVWLFLRAKYVFGTHGYFKDVKSPKRQKNVNLWHGCGYKNNPQKEKGYRGNYNIVTSELYIPIHADLFDIEPENVIITGLPRNDVLYKKHQKMDLLGINVSDYKRIIIWLPTYRKASIGHDGVDGSITDFGYRDLLENAKEINELLVKAGYLLLLKLHPLEEKAETEHEDIDTNIRLIPNKRLSEEGISLYELFGETDVLISDYSSVVIDYLLTGKSVAFVTGDYEAYKNNRGFVFSDMKSVMPGPVIKDKSEFMDYIGNLDEMNESYDADRKRAVRILHKYTDGNSSKRVVDYFFGKGNENV